MAVLFKPILHLDSGSSESAIRTLAGTQHEDQGLKYPEGSCPETSYASSISGPGILAARTSAWGTCCIDLRPMLF